MVYYEPRGTGKSEAPKTIEGYSQNYLVQEIEDLRKFLNVEKYGFLDIQTKVL